MKMIRSMLVVLMFCGVAVAAQAEQDDYESKFVEIAEKYKTDSGFRAYVSRLKVAQFLAKQMIGQLEDAKQVKLREAIFSGGKGKPLSIAPAVDYFNSCESVFRRPITMGSLSSEEKGFLIKYYNWKLRSFCGQIASAGQGLSIAEPGFKNTYDYVLVLPLLHCFGGGELNVEQLPKWMMGSVPLGELYDRVLLHFGNSYQAMVLARERAVRAGEEFSESSFYVTAAKKCGVKKVYAAVDCLNRAIAASDVVDEKVELLFEINSLWSRNKNYELAAGAVRQIAEKYPEHKEAGRAIWLKHFSLSKCNQSEAILKDIDADLADEMCKEFRTRILYTKWWTLKRMRDMTGRIEAVEYELIRDCGDDAIVAPIFLSRASDLLSGHEYELAALQMKDVIKRFPHTQAAKHADKLLKKLKMMLPNGEG